MRSNDFTFELDAVEISDRALSELFAGVLAEREPFRPALSVQRNANEPTSDP